MRKNGSSLGGEYKAARPYFDELEAQGPRLVTEQDKAIYNLCRPERLLELAYRFTIFDAGIKKIARYQQFFVVRSTVKRLKRYDAEGRRQGGVIWHTQGSGKSLTMVMLTRALALDTDIINPRIILVTDRDDLDKQLGNTLAACGLTKERAVSGGNLVKHLKDKVGIITTLIHKFDKGWAAEKYINTCIPAIYLFWLMKATGQISALWQPECARCYPIPAIWALQEHLCSERKE